MSKVQFNNGTQVIGEITTDGTDILIKPLNGARVRIQDRPVFHAYGIGGGSWQSHSYVIFPSVAINEGNCYDPATGIFTAPYAGIYEFFWSSISWNGDDVHRISLFKNGSGLPGSQLRLDTHATGSNYSTNASRVYIAPLVAGDEIRIWHRMDSSADAYPFSNDPDNQYWNFAGYMLV